MYGIVRDLIEQCIAQTPDVWEWTDEVAFAAYYLNHMTLALALALALALWLGSPPIPNPQS